MKALKRIVFVFSLLAVVLLFVAAGCGKDEPAAKKPAGDTIEGTMDKMADDAGKAVDDAKKAVESIEQTTCPIMGKAIDKNIFVEHEGKKVYFCCAGCKDTFAKAPEKYLEKLPQFKLNE